MGKIVIIGNGISGITAARHIRKRGDDEICVISAETDHFFSRTALMYVFMGHMQFEHTKPYEDWFWEKNRIELKRAFVESVSFSEKQLNLSSGEQLGYDKLIIACGSKPNMFGWPGQDLDAVQGLYSVQDLENMEKFAPSTTRAVIVGGGLIGVEMAEMYLSRGIAVTFLVREDRFWGNVLPKEEGLMVARHMVEEHHIDLRFSTELKAILPDDNGRARAVVTNAGEEIACQAVGLTAGVGPNVQFLKDSELTIDRGIVVNRYLETNIEDVYAVGDCAQFESPAPGRRPLEQVWYTGRMMGETVAKTVTGDRTMYSPGIWFNSAKFFDIEYQTYGQVTAEAKPEEEHFYWEHPSGKISFRAVFDKSTARFKATNVFGMRIRHELMDKWIRQEKSVDYVIEHLHDANFDPEFYKTHAQDIVNAYNKQYGKTLKAKKKSLANIFNLRSA